MLIRATSRPARSGFTMIELLVVVAVIGLLISVLLVTVQGFLGNARRAATITTIQKIANMNKERSQALTNHIQSLQAAFDKFVVDGGYLAHAGNDLELAKVLATKDMFRQTFPQKWAEVGISSTNPASGAESAEVMYYALTGEEIPGTGTPAASIRIPGYQGVGRDAFSTTEYADTDLDGRLEIVDGWGKPLQFYRWPTRLVRDAGMTNGVLNPIDFAYLKSTATFLNRALPSGDDLGRDPDDPLALMMKPKWSGLGVLESSNGGDGKPGAEDTDDDNNGTKDDAQETMWPRASGSDDWSSYHLPGTYHTPLILSAGPDNKYGLYDAADMTNGGFWGKVRDLTAITDDITNLNMSP